MMNSETKTGRVLALGFFDGVHLGHGALLKRTAEVAAQTGAMPCAMTFDTHPEALITKTPLPLLNTVSDRVEMIRRLYGIEEVIFAHFDDALMHMSWQSFIQAMLIDCFHATHVVAGHDFHFGYKGKGNPVLLAQECARLGLGCDIIPCVEMENITISSTYIRKLVAQGDMERAAHFLGHPHGMSGIVGHGQKLGSLLGVPTVNLSLPEGLQCPAHGVYASVAYTDDGEARPAVTNIGLRPTVTVSQEVTMETHILDFSGNLYGRPLRLELLKFLRPEARFASLEELKLQISSDIDEARAYQACIRRGNL